MNPQEFNKENENLSYDDIKLGHLLRSLDAVEAPADFDFRLKARIAGAASSRTKSRFVWAFRFAVPVLAIALVAILFAVSGKFGVSDTPQTVQKNQTINEPGPQTKTETADTAPAPTVKVAEIPEKSNPELPKTPKNEIARVNRRDVLKESDPQKKKDMPEGSRDISSKKPAIIQPDFNNGNSNQKPRNFESATPISIQSVLSELGVKAAVENGKWVVKSLNPNSLAERSGIRIGDVLETIDERSLQPDTVFTKSVEGKTLTVTRDGKKIVIALKNK